MSVYSINKQIVFIKSSLLYVCASERMSEGKRLVLLLIVRQHYWLYWFTNSQLFVWPSGLFVAKAILISENRLHSDHIGSHETRNNIEMNIYPLYA